jgi:hypothetical protein
VQVVPFTTRLRSWIETYRKKQWMEKNLGSLYAQAPRAKLQAVPSESSSGPLVQPLVCLHFLFMNTFVDLSKMDTSSFHWKYI